MTMYVEHKKSKKLFAAVESENEGYVVLTEVDDPIATKEIKNTTFKKSYKEVNLDDKNAPEEKTAPPIEPPQIPNTQTKPEDTSLSRSSDEVDREEGEKNKTQGKAQEISLVALTDLFFIHDGTDEPIKVEKGDSLEFLEQGAFTPISMKEYGDLKAKWEELNKPIIKKETGTIDLGNVKDAVQYVDSTQVKNGWGAIAEVKQLLNGEPTIIETRQAESVIDAHKKEEEVENSMRASRDHKNDNAIPFVPKPFFLRQSMISSYLQCPSKMYNTYENGFSEDTIFTKTGTAVHGLMEDYHKSIMEGNTFTRDQYEACFNEWWGNHGPSEPDWFETWHKIVMNRYDQDERQKYAPNVLALELEFRTEINGVPFSGTIDRIDRIDNNTIEIIDYKTNFRLFSKSEVEESVQFKAYTLAVKTKEVREQLKAMGDSGEFTTVICTYDMLRLGAKQSICYDNETMEIYEKWLKFIWDKILSGKDRNPQINNYCGFCEMRNNCTKYQELLDSDISPILLTETTDPKVVVDSREKIQQNTKILKNRLDELDAQLKLLIGDKGSLVVGEHEFTLQSSRRQSYPSQDVIKIMAMNGMGARLSEFVTISSSAIKKLPPEVMKKVNDVAVTTYTKPSITKKKYKPKKV